MSHSQNGIITVRSSADHSNVITYSNSFERLRGGVIANFVQSLKSLREHEIWPLSALLSPHLEAILEGNECLLGVMIENGSLDGWSDVLAHHHQLSTCPHLRTDL